MSVLYGCRLLEVVPLDDSFEPDTGNEVLLEVPQEAGVDPDILEGPASDLRGGDRLVARIEEEDYLVGLNITFNNAELSPEAVLTIAGGGELSQIRASLTTGALEDDNAIVWQAVDGGTGGNAIQVEIEIVANSEISIGVISNDITVTLPSAFVSAAAVIAAVNADGDASALVRAYSPKGSDGSGYVEAVGQTNLTGGSGDYEGWEAPDFEEQHDGRAPFEARLYVAQYEEGANAPEEVVGFLEFIFPYCKGRVPSVAAAGQSFMVPSFTIYATENKHTDPKQGCVRWRAIATDALPE